jgi:hypothetical protein
MSTYNGWANYETWRVNLEVLDGLDFSEVIAGLLAWDRMEMVEGLARHLEDTTYELMEWPEVNTFAHGIVTDFLGKVDWEEIAGHHVDDYLQENPIEEEDTDA